MADPIKVSEGDIVKGLTFGKSKTFEEATEGILFPIVKRWTELNIDAAREFLEKEGRAASNVTGQELEADFKFNSDTIFATVKGPLHAKFLDKGVSGVEKKRDTEFKFKTTYPNQNMAESIQSWVTSKGLFREANDFESLSYAIATNVKKKGIEKSEFITKTFSEDSLTELAKAVTQALGANFTAAFKFQTSGSNDT